MWTLCCCRSRKRIAASGYTEDPAGVHSFAAQVDDIDEAIAALDEHKVEWAGDLKTYGAGQFLDDVPGDDFKGIWYRFRSFYDPEGNVMHICEVHPPAGFDRSIEGKA
jgi:isopenicillin-N N-acyltransferase-like protein